jgi:hypothetical protein
MSSSLRADASGLLGALTINGTDSVTFDAAGISAGVEHPLKSIVASVAANALTVGLAATTLEFRSSTLSIGATTRLATPSLTMTVPSGATLGTVNAVSSRILLLAINNAGTIELAVANSSLTLDETTLISTTALSSSANSASVVYSVTARTNVPFRVIGYVDSTQAVAGTWATTPSTVQGSGGSLSSASGSKLVSAGAQASTSGTSIDFTGIPSWAKRITVLFNSVSTNGASAIQVQIGNGTAETTGYQSGSLGGAPGNSLSGGTNTTGFLPTAIFTAASTITSTMTLHNISGNNWIASGIGGATGGSTLFLLCGVKTTSNVVDRLRVTTVNGTDVFDAGTINIFWE